MKRFHHAPLAGVVIGLSICAARNAGAASYTYESAVGNGVWKNAANWDPDTGYPGDTAAQTDNANVIQPANADYSVTLDSPLAGTLGVLTAGNPSGNAKATVVLATPLNSVGDTVMQRNGRVVVDGVEVAGGALAFENGGALVLDKGGSRVISGNQLIGTTSVGAVTALVTSAQSPAGSVTGGLWRVGSAALHGKNFLRIKDGVTLQNVELQAGNASSDNTILIDNATVNCSSTHLGLGVTSGGVGGNGNLIHLDNGAVLKAGNAFNVGNQNRDNKILVAGGSRLYGFAATAAFGRGGTNHSITVTGGGSLMEMGGNSLRMGGNVNNAISSGIRLRVLDGGTMQVAQLQLPEENGAAHDIGLVVSNGTLRSTGHMMLAINGRDSSVEVTGKKGLVTSHTSTAATLSFGYCELAAQALLGARDNFMRVHNGGTVSNCNINIASANTSTNAVNMFRNTLEIADGGRVFVPSNLHLCRNATNCWDNVITVKNGSLLETANIYVNDTPKTTANDVYGNYIWVEDSVLQFRAAKPAITLNLGATLTLKNGVLSFRDITGSDDFNIPVLTTTANTAKITYVGDTALRFSNSYNRGNNNQAYTFDKGLGAPHFYRLDMVDGATQYRTQTPASQLLAFGAQGEHFCSNTTATVAIKCENNGKLVVLDSTVNFQYGLTLNGDLHINTDAAARGRNIITVDNGLTLGPNARIFISGKSREPVTIQYTGALVGKFAEKICADSHYAVSYGAGSSSAITFQYAPPATILMLR